VLLESRVLLELLAPQAAQDLKEAQAVQDLKEAQVLLEQPAVQGHKVPPAYKAPQAQVLLAL
jgi:hypothetical protein